MKSGWLVCLVLASMLLNGCAQMENHIVGSKSIRAPGQHPQAFAKRVTKSLSCNYLLFLPEGYGQQEQDWPMILFLHGAGERGDDLQKVKKHGPPKIVDKRKDFPFIVVSPQCPEDDWWTEKTDVLINLLDEIVAKYDVDEDRIYLTGLSMGGYGTWTLAWAYPERFAAIAPICGGGKRFMARRLDSVPIWAFHGAKDRVVPQRESEEMVKAVRASGGSAKLTIYPDAGHDSWTETYKNQKLYDWFLSHRRVAKTE